jgi:ABC-type spermidine/putrescine transport system permease subunit II
MAEERARRRPPLAVALTIVAYALLYAPLLAVVAYSLLAPGVGGRLEPSLAWYAKLFGDEAMGAALGVSLRVAAATSLIAAVLGTLGAFALERGRFPGAGVLAALTLVPLVLPELVQGLASLVWFVLLKLTLGVASIVLAHATFAVSYVVVTVRARLRRFDPDLADAAADLGARPLAAFLRVQLPLAAPGIAAGALMAFALSFDDFLISFFTAGVNADTLPMRLYSMVRFGVNAEMYALSATLIAVTATILLGTHAFSAWRARTRATLPPADAARS